MMMMIDDDDWWIACWLDWLFDLIWFDRFGLIWFDWLDLILIWFDWLIDDDDADAIWQYVTDQKLLYIVIIHHYTILYPILAGMIDWFCYSRVWVSRYLWILQQ
jgi:hypothetical protein